MGHNKYDLFNDIITNIKDFFALFLDEKKNENFEFERLSLINSLKNNENKSNPFSINFPKFMFNDPNENAC